MSDHPHLLPWYVAGTLDEPDRERIREHLADCTVCVADVQRLGSLRESLIRHMPAGHIAEEELVRFADSAASMAAETREHVEAHLRQCAACREDLELLRRVSGVEPRTPPVSRLAVAAVAAVLLLGVIPLTVWLWNGGGPAIEGIEWTTFPPAQRSEQQLVLVGDGPWAVLVLLPSQAPTGEYRVRVENAGGQLLTDVTTDSAADGSLMLSISGLAGGDRYEMTVSSIASPEQTYSYSFRVTEQAR